MAAHWSRTGGSGTNGFINTGADLITSGSWQLALLYSGTPNTIRGFSTNGGANYLPAGTYGATGSGATHILPSALVLGTGVLNVTAVPATVLLTTSGSPSTYGSSVTFTSTVSGSTPTGTVTFYDGASAIGVGTISGGQATLTVSDLLATTSPHSISAAVYSGDAPTMSGPRHHALAQTVNPLTISPATLSVSNKVYDGTAAAVIILTNSTITGVLAGDTNNVHIASGTAVFSDKNIGTNKTVTITGLTLGGSLAANYSLVPNSGTSTANISNAPTGITNLSVNTRPYNTTTAAPLNTSIAGLTNIFGTDNVTLNTSGASGTYANASPGTNKAVTVTGFAINGNDATNYTLSQPAGITGTIVSASTTNVLVSSANPSGTGSNVTFTVTVTAVGLGAGTPTGNVAIITNGVLFSSVSLTNGVTAVSTSGSSERAEFDPGRLLEATESENFFWQHQQHNSGCRQCVARAAEYHARWRQRDPELEQLVHATGGYSSQQHQQRICGCARPGCHWSLHQHEYRAQASLPLPLEELTVELKER